PLIARLPVAPRPRAGVGIGDALRSAPGAAARLEIEEPGVGLVAAQAQLVGEELVDPGAGDAADAPTRLHVLRLIAAGTVGSAPERIDQLVVQLHPRPAQRGLGGRSERPACAGMAADIGVAPSAFPERLVM